MRAGNLLPFLGGRAGGKDKQDRKRCKNARKRSCLPLEGLAAKRHGIHDRLNSISGVFRRGVGYLSSDERQHDLYVLYLLFRHRKIVLVQHDYVGPFAGLK